MTEKTLSEGTVYICHVDEGDRLRVRPGEKSLWMALLKRGSSTVDESMLTGDRRHDE